MIEVEFIGAAQEVTGSKHLLRTSRAAVLLDCGLFQGHRRETLAKNRNLPVEAENLDTVILSHAHIDHSGALPLLCRAGFTGPIYATSATRDLCAPMLLDAAMLQESDARHIDRLIQRGVDIDPVEPLYREQDVITVLGHMIGLPYHRKQTVAPGVTLRFLEAGHVLGSAIVVLDVEDEGRTVRIAFTGDLGRHHLPILRDPEVPDGVEVLITESTYGDRCHDSIELMGDALADVVCRTYERGGKIVIPSFALERAQEIVYELKRLREQKRIPALPVYLDSPLAVKLTEIFRLHPECYDDEARKRLQGADSPFEFDGLRYVSSVEESQAIDAEDRPSIVISASGMCEGGRVLHHLRRTIGDRKNTVVIVGFQAQHTLGRRILERRREVRIFGVMQELRAEVVALNGFSAHADQTGLVDFAESVRTRGSLRRVILVHGEPGPQQALVRVLAARGFTSVETPAPGDRLRL